MQLATTPVLMDVTDLRLTIALTAVTMHIWTRMDTVPAMMDTLAITVTSTIQAIIIITSIPNIQLLTLTSMMDILEIIITTVA